VQAAGLSFAEACALLGISAHTLRRRIQAGEIQAERVSRPQGYAWRVYVRREPAEQTSPHVTSDVPAAILHPQPAAAGTPPDGHALALALAPLVEAAVAPIRAELADVRAVLSARDQELGQLRAEMAAYRHPDSPQDAPQLQQVHAVAQQVHRPWWAFWRS